MYNVIYLKQVVREASLQEIDGVFSTSRHLARDFFDLYRMTLSSKCFSKLEFFSKGQIHSITWHSENKQ